MTRQERDRERYLRQRDERLKRQREYYATHREQLLQRKRESGFLPYGSMKRRPAGEAAGTTTKEL